MRDLRALQSGKSTKCDYCGRRKRKNVNRLSPGDTFGQWTVVKDLGFDGKAHHVLVRCSCGRELDRRLHALSSGESTRCAWCAGRGRLEVKPGDKFGSWTVIRETTRKNRQRRLVIECGGCGKRYKRFLTTLTRQDSKSCRKCSGNAKKTVRKGSRHGKIVVVRELPPRKRQVGGSLDRYFLVRCDCGREFSCKMDNFYGIDRKGCSGCYGRPLPRPRRGSRYGKWKILKDLGGGRSGGKTVLALCKGCGKKYKRRFHTLVHGHSKGCADCARK